MSTPSSLNVDIDALFATTLQNWREGLHDNIFKDNKLTAFLKDSENGVRREGDGGERITEKLMYGKNTTVSSYSGYDKIDTTPQDNISEAYFDWKQIAGSVSISGKELKQNKGRSQILKLFESKKENLVMSMQEELNRQLLNAFSSGNNGKDLVPLPMLVAKDPSNSSWNPVGAIDGSNSADDFWRNKTISSSTGSTSTTDQLHKEALKAYNRASFGSGGSPDIGITDVQTHELLELHMDGRKQYENDPVQAKFGFENLRFKQSALMFDEVVPDVDAESTYSGSEISNGSLFFLNTKFFTLVEEEDTVFEPTEFKKPVDQDAKVGQVLWMGAITVSNRRKHAVVYDINHNLSISS